MKQLIRQIRDGLVQCQQGLAECEATETGLLEACDRAEHQRMEEMARQREAMRGETDAYRLRGLEQQYQHSAVGRAKARRLARHLRNRMAERARAEQRVGPGLIGNRRPR